MSRAIEPGLRTGETVHGALVDTGTSAAGGAEWAECEHYLCAGIWVGLSCWCLGADEDGLLTLW